jgi:chromosome segregation ATPase
MAKTISAKALEQKKLSIESLPSEIKSKFESLIELNEKYNEAIDDYDKQEERDEEIEKELGEMEEFIQKTDTEVAELINNFNPEPEVVPEPTPTETKAPKEEKDNTIKLGWLIFGGIVLVATVGAVNMFKKR